MRCVVGHLAPGMNSRQEFGQLVPVYAKPSAALVHGSVTPRCPDRPARVQVEQKRALQTVEHAGDYNIWYGKYMGENSFERAPRASTRVLLETDAGLTRADYTGNAAHLCLHFARGDCIYGKDCTYRHCAPTEQDESQVDTPHDVFGRTRHGSFRQDMGGTGTWNKDCKTLYVGRLCGKPSEQESTEIVARHFGEFGQLESVRVLKGKACAFVTYRMRCTAEFAKEAMAEQALDHDEQINVRWAFDDPNPKAQAVRLRNSAQLMLAAMEAKGHLPSTAEGAYPEDLLNDNTSADDEHAGKRQRVSDQSKAPMTREEHYLQQAEMQASLEAAARAAEDYEAYAAAEAAKAEERALAASNASRLDAILSSIDCGGSSKPDEIAPRDSLSENADPMASFLVSVDDGKTEPTAEAASAREQASNAVSLDSTAELPPGVYQPRGLPEGWREYRDPTSGHPYYVSSTGESTWRHPSR